MKRAVLWLLLAGTAWSGERYARWEWYDAAAIPYLQEAGITQLLVNASATSEFAAACEKAGIHIIREAAPAGVQLATQGKWPGLDPHIQVKPGAESATTSATGEHWIDSTAWLILYHRAVSSQPVLLAYDPPKNARLRPGSLELAVADATVFGGNVVLKLDDRLRQGLAGGQPRTVAEW